jgi:hypothetical protein
LRAIKGGGERGWREQKGVPRLQDIPRYPRDAPRLNRRKTHSEDNTHESW